MGWTSSSSEEKKLGDKYYRIDTRSGTYSSSDDHEEALQFMLKKGKSSVLFNNKANIFRALQKYSEAHDNYDNSLKMRDNSYALYGKALTYIAEGNYKCAEERLIKCKDREHTKYFMASYRVKGLHYELYPLIISTLLLIFLLDGEIYRSAELLEYYKKYYMGTSWWINNKFIIQLSEDLNAKNNESKIKKLKELSKILLNSQGTYVEQAYTLLCKGILDYYEDKQNPSEILEGVLSLKKKIISLEEISFIEFAVEFAKRKIFCPKFTVPKSNVEPPNPSPFHGLIFRKVLGDGHCLYHSVGLYVNETQDWLRRFVATYLDNHISEYQDIIKAFLKPSQTCKGYINDIRSGKEWADDLEITVLMHVLDRPIIIIDPNYKIRNPHDIGKFKGEPIFVYYNGIDHYDALLPNEDMNANEILQCFLNDNNDQPDSGFQHKSLNVPKDPETIEYYLLYISELENMIKKFESDKESLQEKLKEKTLEYENLEKKYFEQTEKLHNELEKSKIEMKELIETKNKEIIILKNSLMEKDKRIKNYECTQRTEGLDKKFDKKINEMWQFFKKPKNDKSQVEPKSDFIKQNI